MKWLKQLEMNPRKLWLGWPVVGAWWADEAPRVEEPPFVPFDLSRLGAETRADLPAATAPEAGRPPANLAELGVPTELAHNFEVAFGAIGATAGGRVIGYRFRTPDGVSHPLRLDDAA
jgi:hypothetical protein